ncbi:MAG: hypothetical protein JOZ62_07970 [Acidobacteriaceae bacterium]|nr:hypothetical protein [Acidobacteriaceae bacterium]
MRQQEAMRQAMSALERAEDDMRNAVSNRDRTAQARAAAQLAEAEKLLKDMLHQEAGNSMSDLARSGQQLARQQKDLATRIKQQYGAAGINTARSTRSPGENGGSVEMPEMMGPDFAAGGGWYRRRYFQPEPLRAATEQEKQLAAESEKLAHEVEQLERQMQQQAADMAGQQPDASKKLRNALSDAEQQELALRMQKNADWLRQGYGEQTWPMEDSISAGLQQLSRQLQDAQQGLRNGNPNGRNSPDDSMAQALGRVRSLREQLESQSQQGGNQSGSNESQNGQAQSSGQPGAQASGNQQSGDSYQYGNWNDRGGWGPRIGGRGYWSAVDDLAALRAQLGRNDRELNTYFNDALGYLRRMYGQAGLLDKRINEDAVASLERLEIELVRRANQQQQQHARTAAAEAAPEKYRDAVAEYFRRLSK